MASEYLTIRIPKRLKDEIAKWADEERRTISMMGLLLLEKAVYFRQSREAEARGEKPPPRPPIVRDALEKDLRQLFPKRRRKK